MTRTQIRARAEARRMVRAALIEMNRECHRIDRWAKAEIKRQRERAITKVLRRCEQAKAVLERANAPDAHGIIRRYLKAKHL